MSQSPKRQGHPPRTAVQGALAGLIGGIAFGAAMIELGVLPTVASLVRTDAPVVGFIVHMAIAATVGAGLATLLRGNWPAGDVLFWGVAYASFFWFIGPLTLQPLILGQLPTWDLSAAQAAYPSLIGHVMWGATAGLALVAIRARRPRANAGAGDSSGTATPVRGVVVRGVAAGFLAFGLISIIPSSSDRMLAMSDVGGPDLGPLGLALIAAVLFAVLHPRSSSSAGAAVIRGAGFGFLVWVVGGLTLLPVLRGEGLAWSIEDARAAFPALLATMLFGASSALIYHWLCRLGRLFFSDDVGTQSPDGGAWGLRAVARGAAAGLVGGALFTLVMLQIGFLPTVARLIGSDSQLVGLLVHLVIALIVGASYGLLFRRQAFDSGAAIGWGVSYGLVWWVLGPLTLAPIIGGAAPMWTVEAAISAFPSLIGHLAYGAGLGFTFYWFESRFSPWWISRSEVEAAMMEARRAEATSAGPALWALLVLVAVLLQVVLAP